MGGKKGEFKSAELVNSLKVWGLTALIAGLVELTHQVSQSDYIWSGVAVSVLTFGVTALRQWQTDNSDRG